MRKHIEKQPIDDLFAKKLRNVSLPTSLDGFERLQARMGQRNPETRVVFWRNPSIQQYIAAAACLLIVCLFGWLYWPSTNADITVSNQQVAVNRTVSPDIQNAAKDRSKALTKEPNRDLETSTKSGLQRKEEQLAIAKRITESTTYNNRLDAQSVTHTTPSQPIKSGANEPLIAQTRSIDDQHKPEENLNNVMLANQSAAEQASEVKTGIQPNLPTERVLTVTIDEPSALVAARQASKGSAEEKTILVTNEKPEKEAKAGGLWQQVKRIKHGELFAKRDNISDDERGLLDRAYSGLKHSLDKDKSAKQ